VFRRRRTLEDFTAEIDAHLSAEADALKAEGVNDAAARQAARRAFGNRTRAREDFYESARWRAWEALLRDLRYAARSLAKAPGMLTALVACLGLAIGLNAAVFSVFDGVILRKPTARDPDRLVSLEPGNGNRISYLNYRDLQHVAALAETALIAPAPLSLRLGDEQTVVAGLQVSGNYFDMLGVHARFGRTFDRDEARPETGPLVAVLDFAFWTRQFSGDPRIVGQVIRLNGSPFVVVGVLDKSYRAGFGFLTPDIYVPIGAVAAPLDDRAQAVFEWRGRLADGVSRQQARGAIALAAERLEQAYPRENVGLGRDASVLPVTGIGSLARAGTPATLYAGLAVPFLLVGSIWLVACANVAGVLLARGASRRAEIAARLALGAHRAALVRLLLVESLLIALLSAACGLILALWGVGLANHVPLPNLPSGFRLPPVALDVNVALFGVAMAFVTCVGCGLVPALQATRVDLASAIRDHARGLVGGRHRARTALVVGQVATSALLLSLCGLSLDALAQVMRAEPGFDVDRTLTARVTSDHALTRDQLDTLAEDLRSRLAALPGIDTASYASLIPLGGDAVGLTAEHVGDAAVRTPVLAANVGPSYFRTMGVAVVGGREFLPSDRAGAPGVAIVNETFAKRAFPDGNPLGRVIRIVGDRDDTPREIVGIVRDNKYGFLTEAPSAQVFRPFLQMGGRLFEIVRTVGAPDASAATIARVILDRNPTLLVDVETMAAATSLEVTMRRLATRVLAVVGSLGVLLATIGLFGVLASDVSRRAPEIGIRMALGASPGAIGAAVVRQSIAVVLVSAALGLFLSVVVSLPLRALFAGRPVIDPITAAGVTAIFCVVAAIAGWAPARRAMRTDPLVALRAD
jgi:putative ABC transport system permease protein